MSAGSQGAATVTDRPGPFERMLCGTFAAACLVLVGYKLLLVSRLNVNWDEFIYLSAVHAQARDALSQLFQGAHAHLFLWLTALPGDEIDEIRAARLVMVALLAATAWLIWLLGRRWLSGFAAFVPPFIYLSAVPVMQHGGSFRVDSLLAPLLLAALICCTRPAPGGRFDWYGGVLLGVAFALTLKTVLFLPMIVAALALRQRTGSLPGDQGPTALAGIGKVLLAAFACGVLLLLMHAMAIAALPTDSVGAYGARVAGKALLDVPLLSQADRLVGYAKWQPLPWLLIALGAAMALMQRRWQVSTLGLALLPILFYRNAFPYFYVVMLAPAAILAGVAVQQLAAMIAPRTVASVTAVLIGVIAGGLIYQAKAPVRVLWEPQQASQRRLLAAVHDIFPQPVNYVDCCAMVSSFRKVNFFMSTWGMEIYRARHSPFMDQTLERSKPSFVLVNSLSLDPDQRLPKGLLPEDLDRIRRFYPPYWGPIRVAGAEGWWRGSRTLELTVPFAGQYRLATDVPVRIDGRLRADGEVISVTAPALTVRVEATGNPAESPRVALFIATARAPPASPPPPGPVFSPL